MTEEITRVIINYYDESKIIINIYERKEGCKMENAFNHKNIGEDNRINFIISNKFKSHMEAHKDEFFVDYTELIQEFSKSQEGQALEGDFIKIAHDFDRSVGIENVVRIKDDEEIIYAKRKGRDIYSKFVIRDKSNLEKTSKVMLLLNKNRYKNNSYYIITMFPGENSEKEPEDKNIYGYKELNKVLEFWKDRAFVWDKDLVQEDTITAECPYIELYTKVNGYEIA